MAPGIGETLRGLFGGGAAKEQTDTPVEYKGYSIQPTPQREGSQWITSGVIRKNFGETVKEHKFIRSDFHASRDSAADYSITKGEQIIDLEGDRIFD